MERDLDRYLPLLGWLYIGFGLIFFVVGLFVLLFFGGIGAASGEAEAFAILSTIGTVTAVFLFAVGLPGIIAGWGLLNRRPWARILAIVLGFLNLFSFPVGTLLGGFALWLLWGDDAEQAFG